MVKVVEVGVYEDVEKYNMHCAFTFSHLPLARPRDRFKCKGNTWKELTGQR